MRNQNASILICKLRKRIFEIKLLEIRRRSSHEWLIYLLRNQKRFSSFERCKVSLRYILSVATRSDKFQTGFEAIRDDASGDSFCALTFLQLYPSPSISSCDSHFLYRCIFHAVWIVGFKEIKDWNSATKDFIFILLRCPRKFLIPHKSSQLLFLCLLAISVRLPVLPGLSVDLSITQ